MLGIVAKELVEADPGLLEDLGQGRAFYVPGVVGHREVDRAVCRVGEVVVAAFDVVQDVTGVPEGPADSSWLEGRNAGVHTERGD